ncbi:hypothetical protein [Candidatus Darwinibacter acetoxidans]|jgi:LacI family transcriptional regulator|nr:hypothetical protein [Limnochordia bacterium]HOQ74165.1 hypothetical protein [Limnochordia bacterium]HPU64756.1 hypothetical protein [Limnochordia bacterium]HQE37051.1 hypothetical protein [Limnochordia bacterium]
MAKVQVIQSFGSHLVLLSTEALVSEELSIIRSLDIQYVEKSMISPSFSSDAHRELIKGVKQPVVVMSGVSDDPDICCVLVDSFKGLR